MEEKKPRYGMTRERQYALFAWSEGNAIGGAGDLVGTGEVSALTAAFYELQNKQPALRGHIVETRTLTVVLAARPMLNGEVKFTPAVRTARVEWRGVPATARSKTAVTHE